MTEVLDKENRHVFTRLSCRRGRFVEAGQAANKRPLKENCFFDSRRWETLVFIRYPEFFGVCVGPRGSGASRKGPRQISIGHGGFLGTSGDLANLEP